mmetsp:Transcript_7584/g.15261  ORF Transcript_7584/g.15261 Transcript_7584/m.15261 type:complete len:236 (-) Transcript_7584:1341-2048(-)
MTTECLGGWDGVVRSTVGGNEELAGAGVGQLIASELAPNVAGIFGPQIGIGSLRSTVAGIGSLDENAFGLDGELGEFLLGTLMGRAGVVVARVDSNFDVRIETGVNVRGGIDTSTSRSSCCCRCRRRRCSGCGGQSASGAAPDAAAAAAAPERNGVDTGTRNTCAGASTSARSGPPGDRRDARGWESSRRARAHTYAHRWQILGLAAAGRTCHCRLCVLVLVAGTASDANASADG